MTHQVTETDGMKLAEALGESKLLCCCFWEVEGVFWVSVCEYRSTAAQKG